MLINTIYRQAMEFIDRAHPFRVAFRKVIINCYNMHSPACQSIKENRKSCNNCFSFTGSHLCDLPLMKGNTTNELNIIMDHIPGYLISSGNPLIAPKSFAAVDCYAFPCSSQIPVILSCRDLKYTVLLKSFCCLFNNCKSPWNKLIQCYFQLFVDLFFNLIY